MAAAAQASNSKGFGLNRNRSSVPFSPTTGGPNLPCVHPSKAYHTAFLAVCPSPKNGSVLTPIFPTPLQ